MEDNSISAKKPRINHNWVPGGKNLGELNRLFSFKSQKQVVKPHHICACLIKSVCVGTKTVTKACSWATPLPLQVQELLEIACLALLLTSFRKERLFSAERKPKLIFQIKC